MPAGRAGQQASLRSSSPCSSRAPSRRVLVGGRGLNRAAQPAAGWGVSRLVSLFIKGVVHVLLPACHEGTYGGTRFARCSNLYFYAHIAGG